MGGTCEATRTLQQYLKLRNLKVRHFGHCIRHNGICTTCKSRVQERYCDL